MQAAGGHAGSQLRTGLSLAVGIGGANAVTLTSLTTEISGQWVDEVVFRTSAADPSGSLQLRYTTAEGTAPRRP